MFPILIVLSIKDIICDIINNIKYSYLKKKKYNKDKIRKRLYHQICKILVENKEIVLCRDFYISSEEYSLYTTLKYLFTKNKDTFLYKKGSDKCLFYFYDFNAHEDGFVEKWIEEIKSMFECHNFIECREDFVEDYYDETVKRSVLRISLVN